MNLFSSLPPLLNSSLSPTDGLPSSADLGVQCEDISYNLNMDSYTVTLTVEMNSAFIPAIVNAIDYLRVDVFEVTDGGKITAIPRILTDQRLMHINATAIENVFRVEIPSQQEGVEFFNQTVHGYVAINF